MHVCSVVQHAAAMNPHWFDIHNYTSITGIAQFDQLSNTERGIMCCPEGN